MVDLSPRPARAQPRARSRGTQKTTSPFEYSGKLTEIMLLGVAALNAGKKIHYDGANMKITNVPNSDALLKHAYRSGWELT